MNTARRNVFTLFFALLLVLSGREESLPAGRTMTMPMLPILRRHRPIGKKSSKHSLSGKTKRRVAPVIPTGSTKQ